VNNSALQRHGLRFLLYFSCGIIPLIALCVVFIDAPLARTIEQLLQQNRFAWKHTRSIPNLLSYFTAVTTGIMLVCCLAWRRREERLLHFFQLTAIAVPLAFLLKVFLQDAFGRTSIRIWLRIGGGAIDFNWFHPLNNSGGFPSGHTAVFTALLYAVWLYFPKQRPLAALAILLLGTALIVTNSHFLSDVFAGIYCGVLVTAGVQAALDSITPTTVS
jgi:membrane-associated phospholipid phosphatase